MAGANFLVGSTMTAVLIAMEVAGLPQLFSQQLGMSANQANSCTRRERILKAEERGAGVCKLSHQLTTLLNGFLFFLSADLCFIR